jgi:hypothetical protein
MYPIQISNSPSLSRDSSEPELCCNPPLSNEGRRRACRRKGGLIAIRFAVGDETAIAQRRQARHRGDFWLRGRASGNG